MGGRDCYQVGRPGIDCAETAATMVVMTIVNFMVAEEVRIGLDVL